MEPNARNGTDWEAVTRHGRLPVLLVRHAATAWNRERRFLGRSDVPLDEEGRRQADLLARRLAGIPLAAIHTSPLARARETAAAICGGRIPVRLEPELVELDQGDLEGRSRAEMTGPQVAFLHRWFEDPADMRIPGGETLRECQARGLAALERIAASAAPGAPVAVVSHQMLIASVLCHVLERPLSELRTVSQRNTAVSLLAWSDGAFSAEVIDDAAHLDP